MTTLDVYGMTDQLEDAMLDVMVTRLEARGKHPFFAKMLQEYLDAMEIDSAKSVLDMGLCSQADTIFHYAKLSRSH